jgi:tetratricopeptide (TPR) repeat protein
MTQYSFVGTITLLKTLFRNLILLIPLLLLLSSGCGFYHDFTAYFNTYYNAERQFSVAVDELEASPQKDRDTNYFAAYVATDEIRGRFDSVIVKCSRIIEFYSQSSYVPSAMLMLGETYAYRNEANSALKEFGELLTNFPQCNERFEARLWIAKTEYFDKKPDDAAKSASDLVPDAHDAGKHDIEIEAIMLQAQVCHDLQEDDRALDFYNKAMEVDTDSPFRAIAAYESGVLARRLDKKEDAAKSYKRALTFKPSPDLRYKSRLEYATLSAEMGKYDEALQVLDDMRYDQVKPEYLAEIDAETANDYNLMGDTAKAFELYRYIDTTYRGTAGAENAFYHRGLFYEKKMQNYRTAYKYYQLAHNVNVISPITPLVLERFNTFDHYFAIRKNIADYDSMLQVYHNKSLRADSTDTLKGKQLGGIQKGDTTKSNLANNGSNVSTDTTKNIVAAVQKTDTTKRVTQNFDTTKSNSTAKNIVTSDTGQNQAKFKPPDVPNAGISQQLMPGRGRIPRSGMPDAGLGASTKGMANRKDTTGGSNNFKNTFPQINLATLTPDTLKYLIVRNKFELGGVYFLELKMLDSAESLYNQVVSDSTKTPFIPGAYYAIGEIHRSEKDSVFADSLDRMIVEKYPKTEYARSIRKAHGELLVDERNPARDKYEAAMNTLTDSTADSTIVALKAVMKEYDTTTYAPKAEYAIGWIYEDILVQNDSAAVYYRDLVKKYPQSAYALEAGPKVAVKDDPKSLDQYVKIKEIAMVQKTSSAHKGKAAARNKTAQQTNGESLQQTHGKDRDVEQDPEEDDDDDTGAPDSGSNNN